MTLRHLDPRVGASFGLSFLVVGVAAVALYPTAEPARRAGTVAARPSVRSGGPDQVPATHRRDPRIGAARETLASGAGLAGMERIAPNRRNHTARSSEQVRTLVQYRPTQRRPLAAFTDVRSGESLADVARRVYGTEQATQSLWLANRDQVSEPAASLRSGMLLRTP